VGLRFNPPAGWPPAPAGFTPQPGWQPDPSWPPPPAGWQLWVHENQPPGTVPTSGWAAAAFVLSLLSVVVLSLIFAANAGKATRSATTGVITHRGHMNAFSLRVGDCFDNPTGAHTVDMVTAIPCDQPHNAQIYAKFKLIGPDFSYPGAAVVAQRARSGCDARIGSLDKAITTGAMTIRILVPEETSWSDGHRTVSCMVVNPTATLTTSLLNSTPGAG
jgi:Septum formation